MICILDVGICIGFGLSASLDNLSFFTDVSDEHSGRSLQSIRFMQCKEEVLNFIKGRIWSFIAFFGEQTIHRTMTTSPRIHTHTLLILTCWLCLSIYAHILSGGCDQTSSDHPSPMLCLSWPVPLSLESSSLLTLSVRKSRNTLPGQTL